MNTIPTDPANYPLVAAYLRDLDSALLTADPQEREDIVSAVKEHLTEALPAFPDATAQQIHDALRDLGPVEHIAANTTRDQAPRDQAPRHPSDSAGIGMLLGLIASWLVLPLLPFVTPIVAATTLTLAIIRLRRPAPDRRPWLSWTVIVLAGTTLAALVVLILGIVALRPGQGTSG